MAIEPIKKVTIINAEKANRLEGEVATYKARVAALEAAEASRAT